MTTTTHVRHVDHPLDDSAYLDEFVWIWNRLHHWTTPGVHQHICRWLERNYHQPEAVPAEAVPLVQPQPEQLPPGLLLLAFRSCGKSSLAALFSVWLLYRNPNLRVLVIAADEELALKMTGQIRRIIETHPLSKSLRPTNSWAARRFTVQRPIPLRDPSVLAKGIGANLTGSRADIVICDDVEVPKTCSTSSKRRGLRKSLAEIDYILEPGGMILYLGTPHSHDSIYLSASLKKKAFLDGYETLRIPIHDEQGKAAWNERFSKQRIQFLRQRSDANKFSSQMLLQPVLAHGQRLRSEYLVPYREEIEYCQANGHVRLTLGERRLVSVGCWWDPSWGGRGDGSVIAAVFTDEDGRLLLHDIAWLRHDPKQADDTDEATQLCRQAVQFARRLFIPAIHIETNGIGKFLPSLLRRELRQQRVACAVIEIHQTKPKVQRILEAFDVVLAARALHVHESVSRTPFIEEMRQWQPDASCRDDALDAVSGCLLSQPIRLGHHHLATTNTAISWQGMEPRIAPSHFSV